MEALHSLGIDWKMLIAQIINFLVLLFILNKLLYKPIISLFEQRRLKIEKGLKEAEKAEKAFATAKEEIESMNQKAYADANEIIQNAKAEASEEAKVIVNEAQIHAEKLVKNAALESQSMKEAAIREAKSHISELISTSLGQVVKNQLDQETKDKLTSAALRELND